MGAIIISGVNAIGGVMAGGASAFGTGIFGLSARGFCGPAPRNSERVFVISSATGATALSVALRPSYLSFALPAKVVASATALSVTLRPSSLAFELLAKVTATAVPFLLVLYEAHNKERREPPKPSLQIIHNHSIIYIIGSTLVGAASCYFHPAIGLVASVALSIFL